MAQKLFSRRYVLLPCLFRFRETQFQPSKLLDNFSASLVISSRNSLNGGSSPILQDYNLFGNGKPGDKEFRKAWEKEMDEDRTLLTYPNEKSDAYLDKLFEFDEKPKYRTISELLKGEQEREELSPGKQARKIAVENALKKLKKGPDGLYTNVWEVMCDLDILVGALLYQDHYMQNLDREGRRG